MILRHNVTTNVRYRTLHLNRQWLKLFFLRQNLEVISGERAILEKKDFIRNFCFMIKGEKLFFSSLIFFKIYSISIPTLKSDSECRRIAIRITYRFLDHLAHKIQGTGLWTLAIKKSSILPKHRPWDTFYEGRIIDKRKSQKHSVQCLEDIERKHAAEPIYW